MKIQDYIKHENTGFYISLGAVLIQSIHTMYILTKLSSLGSFGGLHSFFISILISGSILYFTVKGKTKIALGAAILESYFNICYYVLYINTEQLSWYYLFIAIPSSLALPTVLALFSHEIVIMKENKTTPTNFDVVKALKGKELEFEYKSGAATKMTKVKVK